MSEALNSNLVNHKKNIVKLAGKLVLEIVESSMYIQ